MDTPNNNSPINTQVDAPKKNTLMAALAYIGPLVIVSFIVAKDDPFVKFHIKQGLVLFVIEVIVWILGMMFYPLWSLLQLVNLATLILAIVGIVRVTQGKEMELPLVGKYSSYFKF
ncbi:MAG TPA: DUF4870 domain-containing protein [Candidatus Paceibacterota bacterium]